MITALRTLPPFLRFGLIGALGFVVDAGLLQVLVSLGGWDPVAGRAMSIPVAVLATWVFHRSITFEAAAVSLWGSLVRYAAVSAGGATVNFIVYSALVMASPFMAARPVVPLAVASCVALMFNYLGSKHFAFK